MSGKLGNATDNASPMTISNDSPPAIASPIVQKASRTSQCRGAALGGADFSELGGIDAIGWWVS